MFKLVICDEEGKTTVVPLIRDEVTIGRKEGNTIRLTERNISRFHAKMTRQDDAFVIEDVGSLCGTKVNGELLREAQAQVSIADQIAIGDYSLSIRTDVSGDVPLGRQMEPGDQAGIGKVTPHARLVMLSDPEPGREIDLTAELYVVGRSEESNCRIRHPSLSRAHARIDLDAGKWTISDLDSTTGIVVNGLKKDDYVLKAGDVIDLGGVVLRFVAPGEPYDYASPGALDAVEAAPAPKSPKLLLVLGVLAAAATIAIVVGLTMFTDSSDDTSEVLDDDGSGLTFEELVEQGKDKMTTEEWGAAAGFFARALIKKPDSQVAKEMKKLAIEESDARQSLNEALAAEKKMDWPRALEKLSEISRSSRYYEKDHAERISQQFCDELIIKARFTLDTGNVAGTSDVLREIDAIANPTTECISKRKQLAQEMRQKVAAPRPDAGPGGPARSQRMRRPLKEVPQNPYSAGGGASPATAVKNPYASSVSKPRSAKPKSPMGQAREAITRGDKLGAIAILERAGNSKGVLNLLARLYSETGNRAGYDRVAGKFIKIYPDDPAAESYRKHLKR
jgi:ABC transport system ATP-binding/permease protein